MRLLSFFLLRSFTFFHFPLRKKSHVPCVRFKLSIKNTDFGFCDMNTCLFNFMLCLFFFSKLLVLLHIFLLGEMWCMQCAASLTHVRHDCGLLWRRASHEDDDHHNYCAIVIPAMHPECSQCDETNREKNQRKKIEMMIMMILNSNFANIISHLTSIKNVCSRDSWCEVWSDYMREQTKSVIWFLYLYTCGWSVHSFNRESNTSK